MLITRFPATEKSPVAVMLPVLKEIFPVAVISPSTVMLLEALRDTSSRSRFPVTVAVTSESPLIVNVPAFLTVAISALALSMVRLPPAATATTPVETSFAPSSTVSFPPATLM